MEEKRQMSARARVRSRPVQAVTRYCKCIEKARSFESLRFGRRHETRLLLVENDVVLCCSKQQCFSAFLVGAMLVELDHLTRERVGERAGTVSTRKGAVTCGSEQRTAYSGRFAHVGAAEQRGW